MRGAAPPDVVGEVVGDRRRVELVTPAEVKELVPFIDESVILGGFYTPSVGVVDSLRFGTIMRERAQEQGALQVFANTEVLGIDVEDGRVSGSARRAATSRPRSSSSAAASGARGSRAWRARRSR